jgi:hypothetical protein
MTQRLFVLKMSVMVGLFCGIAVAEAGTPEEAVGPSLVDKHKTAPSSESTQMGYHDLICKPNGTEDGFDCADEATPAKIVPIPSQDLRPRPQDVAVTA